MIIYLDELNFFSTIAIFKTPDIEKLFVLERIKFRQKLWKYFLMLFKTKPIQTEFFAGNLKCKDGETCTFKALKISNTIAVNAAEIIINSDTLLQKLNTLYKKNTIELFIAKQITSQINYWVLRALVADTLIINGNLFQDKQFKLYIKAPSEFNSKLITDAFQSISFKYYILPGLNILQITRQILMNLLQITKECLNGFFVNKKFLENDSPLPCVLTLQTETIRADKSYRGQPHWVDFKSPEKNLFKLFILQINSLNTIKNNDVEAFKKTNIHLICMAATRIAYKKFKNHEVILKLRKNRYLLYNFFKYEDNSYYLWRIRVAFLLFQAELIGSLCLMLKIKVFINSEPYILFDSAIQLTSDQLGFSTICYQYSNLGIASNLMISSCDIFITFSDLYNKNLSTNKIGPQKFLEFGYPFNHVISYVSNRALNYRKELMKKGVQFIICYFDERVDHTKWGAVNNADHLAEIHSLVKYLLEEKSVGLVIKSQFIRYSPSRWYPNDELIRAAISTGRCLELSNGIIGKRNDIFPVEASLIADISISHKFGATSGLEAALAGKRVILLNNASYKTNIDTLYSSGNIEYNNINEALLAINKYRLLTIGNDLGDWSKIITNFDKFNDGLSSTRLLNIVNCIANANA